MKETKPRNTLISNLSEEDQHSFEIGDLKYIFETLQKNIYSNKPQAVVREITSNCFDANQESGSKRPIEIILPGEENNNTISFRDFGIGMDSERIDVYRKICASTKRDSNSQIGYFGIGSKSPFSITDSFTVKTIVGNTEYNYIVFKDKDGIPKINKVHQCETTEPTGTLISIPVNSRHDRNEMYE